MHNIEDELIFTNHDGYVFHDSRGIECANEDELTIIQTFVRGRSQERKLAKRIHAIWLYLSFVSDLFRGGGLLISHSQVLCPNGQPKAIIRS